MNSLSGKTVKLVVSSMLKSSPNVIFRVLLLLVQVQSFPKELLVHIVSLQSIISLSIKETNEMIN